MEIYQLNFKNLDKYNKRFPEVVNTIIWSYLPPLQMCSTRSCYNIAVYDRLNHRYDFGFDCISYYTNEIKLINIIHNHNYSCETNKRYSCNNCEKKYIIEKKGATKKE